MPRKGRETDPEPSGSGVTKSQLKTIMKRQKKKEGEAARKAIATSKAASTAPQGSSAKSGASQSKGGAKSKGKGKAAAPVNPDIDPAIAQKSSRRVYDRFLVYVLGIDLESKNYNPIREVTFSFISCTICKCGLLTDLVMNTKGKHFGYL